MSAMKTHSQLQPQASISADELRAIANEYGAQTTKWTQGESTLPEGMLLYGPRADLPAQNQWWLVPMPKLVDFIRALPEPAK